MTVVEFVDDDGNLPQRSVARTRICRIAAGDRQSRFARGGNELGRVVNGALHHRTAAERKTALGEALLKVDDHNPLTSAEADPVRVEANILIRIAHWTLRQVRLSKRRRS